MSTEQMLFVTIWLLIAALGGLRLERLFKQVISLVGRVFTMLERLAKQLISMVGRVITVLTGGLSKLIALIIDKLRGVDLAILLRELINTIHSH